MNEKTKKKKIVWTQYIAMTFFMLIGAVCGYLMAPYIFDHASDTGKPLFEKILYLAGLFLGMYAAILAQIIIHETGHLVFGLLSGYSFSSFRIFSFIWVNDNGKLRLKRLSIAGTGGQCLMAPPDMMGGKIPVVLYNLGGSLMNMIAGCVFLLLFFIFARVPFLSTLMLFFVIIGFIFAIMNGVPMRMGTVDNDGYNAFSLSRDPAAIRAFWMQMKVNEQISRGIRLKDMPDEWFAVPSDEAMKNSIVVVAGVFACNRLIDAQQFEEADKLMAHMLEIDSGMIGLYRGLMTCDRMYVELIAKNRSSILNGMLDKEQKKIMKAMKNFPAVLRTEYAYALLFEKDAIKADSIRTQFEKCAKTYPYPSDIQSERELIEIAAKRKPEGNC